MSLTCIKCGKVRPDKYLGGIRNSTGWGTDKMVCGTCYNKGYEKVIE